ncbi:MAG: protein-L-isoaspartate(D-aspartate) O-methyltransferase, partial [Alphaproteobacteria bacterium]
VGRGVDDGLVADAMRTVPREAFVDPGYEAFAYDDRPLPIGEGQTISQPYTVARMIEAAALRGGEKVLDIGAGSGYAAAIAGRIADHVYAIERHASLAQAARLRLSALGYDNIDIRIGDGTKGWAEHAPFDVILVAASAPEIPTALKQQLAIGARLVIPTGLDERSQVLRKVTRLTETEYDTEDIGAVVFVPLIGEQGWRQER